MARLKDALKKEDLSARGTVRVHINIGGSDKYDHKSGDTYYIQLKIEDMNEADAALEAFMSHELHHSASVSEGRGSSKDKTVYISGL